MYKEYDIVQAKYDLSKTVLKGSKGTILMVYEQPTFAYEIEFIDDEGATLGLLTVKQTDIEY